jgi:leader peptidase (prepilin peptidase)/N-methyltransferase
MPNPHELPLHVLLICAAILGAIVGSFLNVLILRLPQKIQAEHRAFCDPETPMPQHRWFGLDYLISPASQCPHCQQPIRAWQNVPIISWLLLRARCAHCSKPISARYPLVELISSLLTLATVWHFGVSINTLYICIFVWGLITLAVIDFDEQLLPDQLTLPLLWLGLLTNLFGGITNIEDAIIGAAIGYSSLWLVFHLFRLLTGKEGLGYGDFKLFAVLGAWLGWSLLPQILLIASLVGIAIGIGLILLGKHQRENPLPFGPYLAIAGLIALFWGTEINQVYFEFSGIQ